MVVLVTLLCTSNLDLILIFYSLDTVKTRLQGQPHPIKYVNLVQAYKKILLEEGIIRGLYSGIVPALIGSCILLYRIFF